MRFSLTIDTDNAAFGDDNYSERMAEVGRILRLLSYEFLHGPCGDGGKLHDVNGNAVGRWSIGAAQEASR